VRPCTSFRPSPLRHRRILIVESDGAFSSELQEALEREGAETIVAGDPLSSNGVARIGRYQVCAAAIRATHEGVAKFLNVPVLLYGEALPVPAESAAIKEALERLLSR
jgi:DNA-binding NtrC family response regulator